MVLSSNWFRNDSRLSFPFDTFGGQRLASPAALYALMDAYYTGAVWADSGVQADLTEGMNDLTAGFRVRGLFNLVKPIVDFYRDYTQQGLVGVEGDDGVDAWFETENQRIVPALLDVYHWSSLATEKRKLSARAARLGNVLLVVSDRLDPDVPERSTVRIEVRHPGELIGWDFDRVGNLTYAVLETTERTVNPTTGEKTSYLYGRVYTNEFYETRKDGQAFAYPDNPTIGGKPVSRWPNPHGFVPIRVCQHEETEGEFGANAWYPIVDALNELNLRASQVGGVVGQHFSPAYALVGVNPPRSPTTGAVQDVARDGFLYLPVGASASPLVANLQYEGVLAYINRLYAHVVDIKPELTLPELLKAGGNLTGVAVQKMLTGLRVLGETAQANYDAELVKALQMGLSMGKNIAGSGLDIWQTRGYGDIGDYHEIDPANNFDARVRRPDILPLSHLEELQVAREEAALEAEIALIENSGQRPTVEAMSNQDATQRDPEQADVSPKAKANVA